MEIVSISTMFVSGTKNNNQTDPNAQHMKECQGQMFPGLCVFLRLCASIPRHNGLRYANHASLTLRRPVTRISNDSSQESCKAKNVSENKVSLRGLRKFFPLTGSPPSNENPIGTGCVIYLRRTKHMSVDLKFRACLTTRTWRFGTSVMNDGM